MSRHPRPLCDLLRFLLRSGRNKLGSHTRLQWALEAAEGLQYIHEKGIIHQCYHGAWTPIPSVNLAWRSRNPQNTWDLAIGCALEWRADLGREKHCDKQIFDPVIGSSIIHVGTASTPAPGMPVGTWSTSTTEFETRRGCQSTLDDFCLASRDNTQATALDLPP